MQIITVEQMQRHLRKFKKKGNKLKHWMGAPLNRARKLDDGTYEMVISAPPAAKNPSQKKKKK